MVRPVPKQIARLSRTRRGPLRWGMISMGPLRAVSAGARVDQLRHPYARASRALNPAKMRPIARLTTFATHLRARAALRIRRRLSRPLDPARR